METGITLIDRIVDSFTAVLLTPFDPEQRIFWLYLVTSVVVAWFVYRSIKTKGDHATPRDAEAAQGSFLGFLFPKFVWSHPSAWLDLRYMIFHRTVSGVLMAGLGVFSLTLGFRISTGGMTLAEVLESRAEWSGSEFLAAIGFMLATVLVSDFIGWALHYLQHKIPLLWQFHKVHHSAEVMHPVSNFREHPVDNIVYIFFISLGFGLVYGLAVSWLGYEPSMPTLFGVPILMFLFNVVGYNLRHSHVWLRWPGRLSMIFPSPAHHHVHHSCHPDHIDKNFAFMFPIWDVIFGTYTMPEDNRDVKFGVPEEEGRDLDSVLNLYFVPFRDAYRLFVPKRPNEQDSGTEDDASQTKPGIPAE